MGCSRSSDWGKDAARQEPQCLVVERDCRRPIRRLARPRRVGVHRDACRALRRRPPCSCVDDGWQVGRHPTAHGRHPPIRAPMRLFRTASPANVVRRRRCIVVNATGWLMTIKRGADGSKGAFASRTRDTTGPSPTAEEIRVANAATTRRAPEPLSTSLDGFDSEPPTETKISGSGATAVDELFREARGRPSLLSSMGRVLDETRKRLESELSLLRDEAARISADPERSLDDKMTALADVRARMEKPRRRLVSIRRRTRTSVALAARDHDGAAKRARAAFLRAESMSSTTERALALTTIAAELKLPTEASASGGVLRVDVDGVTQRASYGWQLAQRAPSLDDARTLLSLLGGAPQQIEFDPARASAGTEGGGASSTDGTSQLLSRLHDVRST
jgi:hypothetical protein